MSDWSRVANPPTSSSPWSAWRLRISRRFPCPTGQGWSQRSGTSYQRRTKRFVFYSLTQLSYPKTLTNEPYPSFRNTAIWVPKTMNVSDRKTRLCTALNGWLSQGLRRRRRRRPHKGSIVQSHCLFPPRTRIQAQRRCRWWPLWFLRPYNLVYISCFPICTDTMRCPLVRAAEIMVVFLKE